MEENQELLSRISHLAGQINIHKGRQHQNSAASSRFSAFGYEPYHGTHHDRSRSCAGKYSLRSGGFRNRSLVVKRSEKTTPHDATDDSYTMEQSSDAHQDEWVTKRDRHLQLINATHYGSEANRRARSTSEEFAHACRKESHEGLLGGKATDDQGQKSKHNAEAHRLFVDGVAFLVCDGGSRLARENDQAQTAAETPESATIGGVEFRRDHNGDMRRMDKGSSRCLGCVLSPSDADAGRKPCKKFSNTGQCNLGPRCAYVHDPSKVAVCREFLRHGTCKDGEQCNLSHDCSYERVPVCLHFQRGKCTNTDCRYAHIRVNPTAPICRDFSAMGYCAKGSACPDKHVIECPDYSSTGQCSNRGCRLPHIDRASQLRQHDKQAKTGLGESEPPLAPDQRMAIDGDHFSEERSRSDDPEDSDHVVTAEADHASDQPLDGERNFIRL